MMNSKEDDILLALTEDRIDQCGRYNMITTTGFLDLRQRTLVDGLCRRQAGLRYGFYGGYEDAERCVAIFVPDYIEAEVLWQGGGAGLVRAAAWLAENPEDNPLALIRASVPGKQRRLTHRDYLGSLTGLGIRREMIGDILVREDGADILIAKEISEFLIYNYGKAGRSSLELALLPVEELIVLEGRKEEHSDTVASLRLDNVIASLFGTSRGKAAEAVKSGLVFVNGLQLQKPDAPVREGDKLVLRGRGKAVLREIGGMSRKDRIFIRYEKYL